MWQARLARMPGDAMTNEEIDVFRRLYSRLKEAMIQPWWPMDTELDDACMASLKESSAALTRLREGLD